MNITFVQILLICQFFKTLSANAGNGNAFKNNPDYIKPAEAGPVFKIQILTLCCPLPQQATFFKPVKASAQESQFHNQYIYTIGNFKNVMDARIQLNKIRHHYPHACIVEFANGIRLK